MVESKDVYWLSFLLETYGNLVPLGHSIELVLYRLPEPYVGFDLSDSLLLPISFSGAGTCALVRIKPFIFMSQFGLQVSVQPYKPEREI